MSENIVANKFGILRNKSKFTAIALVLMLTLSAFMIFLPTSIAATATIADIAVRPNPVGINQTLLVNGWLTPVGYYYNVTVTITHPDGSKDTYYPITTYSEGSYWFEFEATELGEWKYQVSWPGNSTFNAATSDVGKLTVQEEQIPGYTYAQLPLPTDYWTRPITTDNREWSVLGGDWPLYYYNASWARFNAYTTGPNTAHVLWKEQDVIGGVIGGASGNLNYGYSSVTGPLAVMAGLGFFNFADGMHCIDIHTGKILWVQTGITLNGVERNSRSILTIGTTLLKYDALTGVLRTNVTGTLSGTYVEPYVYSRQTLGNQSRLIKWTVAGTGSFASRIIYNVTYPNAGTQFFYGDIALSLSSGAFNTTTGETIWNGSKIATGDKLYGGPFGAAGYGKVFYAMEFPTRVYKAWDITNGRELWTSAETAYPWGAMWAYTTGVAYGLVYGFNYDGVYAFNESTGATEWVFHTVKSGYETPYGYWPFMTYQHLPDCPVIADGKLYISNFEHSPTNPALKGWKLYCINVTTGTQIWNTSGSIAASAIADGILIGGDRMDGTMFAYGRGQTATTVSVSQGVVENGSTVLIQGTVMDQSPAQPNTPAISDEYMTPWMEYLHKQQPVPANANGVPVTLRAMGSDGSIIEIGTVTSDIKGNFQYMWTPPDAGMYTITATFGGSESYYSSWAAAGLGVTEPPSPPAVQPVQTEAAPAYTGIDLAIIIAVAIAIVIGIVNLYALRKRK